MTPTFNLHLGTAPLLVSMPHLGTVLPDELRSNYVPRALDVEDADWHLNHLYNFLKDMGASILTPVFSRYVIDLNRPPDDAPMYPGASNTELCPTRFFAATPTDSAADKPLAVPTFKSGNLPSNSQEISPRMLCASHKRTVGCNERNLISSCESA